MKVSKLLQYHFLFQIFNLLSCKLVNVTFKISQQTFLVFQDVFSVTLFVFQDVFKTSSRRFQDVFKTSWKTKKCYTEDVFKTSSRRVQYVFTKTNVCWDYSGSFHNDIILEQNRFTILFTVLCKKSKTVSFASSMIKKLLHLQLDFELDFLSN